MTNPPNSLWLDKGLVSQGKILTAILQRRLDDALEMMRNWSTADLLSLEEAATRLARMTNREIRRRRLE